MMEMLVMIKVSNIALSTCDNLINEKERSKLVL